MDNATKKGGAEVARSGPALSKAVQAHLGRMLKACYAQMLREPVPDRLYKLLETIKREENAR